MTSLSTETTDIYINSAAATYTYHSSSPSVNTDAALVKQYHESLPNFATTPLHRVPSLAEQLGVREVLIKSESSRLGLPAFKILGASWGVYRALCEACGLPSDPRVTSLDGLRKHILNARVKDERGFCLYAATDGNHGRAVARMARILLMSDDERAASGREGNADVGAAGDVRRDRHCVIYVPKGMYETTKDLIRDEGARVVTVDGDYDHAVEECWQASLKRGDAKGVSGVMVQDNAFDGYDIVPNWIVEGYATLMQEVDEQFDELVKQFELLGTSITHVVTPIGVGSLGHAVVQWAKSAHRRHKVTVIAVEPETAACLNASLKVGYSKTIQTVDTIMSGMCCGTVSPTSWESLRDGVSASVTVSDWDCHETVLQLSDDFQIEAGPCGAACLAGLRKVIGCGSEASRLLNLDENSTVVVLSTEGLRDYPRPAQP